MKVLMFSSLFGIISCCSIDKRAEVRANLLKIQHTFVKHFKDYEPGSIVSYNCKEDYKVICTSSKKTELFESFDEPSEKTINVAREASFQGNSNKESGKLKSFILYHIVFKNGKKKKVKPEYSDRQNINLNIDDSCFRRLKEELAKNSKLYFVEELFYYTLEHKEETILETDMNAKSKLAEANILLKENEEFEVSGKEIPIGFNGFEINSEFYSKLEEGRVYVQQLKLQEEKIQSIIADNQKKDEEIQQKAMQIAELKSEITRLIKEKESLRKKLDTDINKKQDIDKQLVHLTSEKIQLITKLAQAQKQAKFNEEEIAKLKKENELKNQEILRLSESIKNYDNSISDLFNQEKKLDEDFMQKTKQLKLGNSSEYSNTVKNIEDKLEDKKENYEKIEKAKDKFLDTQNKLTEIISTSKR